MQRPGPEEYRAHGTQRLEGEAARGPGGDEVGSGWRCFSDHRMDPGPSGVERVRVGLGCEGQSQGEKGQLEHPVLMVFWVVL